MIQPGAEYPGLAVQPELGPDEVVGRIMVRPQALHFEAEHVRCALPLEELLVRRGGAGRLEFTHPAQSDWLVATTAEEILDDYFFRRHHRLWAQIKGLREQQLGHRNLKLAAAFVATLAAVAVLLCGITGWTVRFLVNRVPISWETNLSAQAMAELRKEIHFIDPPRWPEGFSNTVERLVQALPENRYQYEFLLVDEPIPNAMALPGGKILVCQGLFGLADQPEEIAGVLAHEMAHVRQRHGLRHVIASMGPYYVLRVFISDRRGFMALVAGGSHFLVQQSFSRDFEREADALALEHLVRANLDPRGLLSFFQKMTMHPLARLSETGTPEVLRSHPPTRERLERLEALAKKLNYKPTAVRDAAPRP